tara:strand:+ start:297 stop:641 length:345 start_codon:yes stop_codon:yes gene_type:complete
MKKIGSIQFFEDIDLNLKFDFNDLMQHFKGDELGIEQNLLDENKNIKMDKLEKFVDAYVNQKIKDKFGDNFYLDVMDDVMNISWDIKVESIKKHHTEEWWNKEESAELPKLKKM